MYIVEGLGELTRDYEPWRVRVGLQPQPQQLLRFLSLDNFGFDKSTVTSAHLKQIKEILVPTIDASWKTMQPINLIRIVGHTDSTGSERYNFGLGDRRAEAIAAELLKIYPRSGRVKIILEKSPGETQPAADNRTAVGQARNRRVEVFIGTLPPPEPPKKPICLTCVPPPPDKPPDIFKPIPPGRPGMSFKQRVEELCEKVLPKSACPTVVDKILSGSCQLLEMLLERAGATMTDKQKEDLRKECLDASKKPIT